MTLAQDEPVTVTAADGILVISLDRPAQHNAMTLRMAVLIAEAMDRLDTEPDLRVGVITGAGGVFCAGMDLKRFRMGERPYVDGRGFGGFVESPPQKPLIAAVEGWALGGGFELALACDILVAGDTAKFGLPEVKRGLIARSGGVFRAAWALPRAIALEMLLTGDPIDAQKAANAGLVNYVVPAGLALDKGVEIATMIAANAPLAVRATKELARESRTWSDTEAFDRQQSIIDPVMASADAQEGIAAFVEHRTPRWTAR